MSANMSTVATNLNINAATTAAAELPKEKPNLDAGLGNEKKFQIEKESEIIQAAAQGNLKL